MSDWIKVPNRSGHMALRKDQIVLYYDIGEAEHAPDSQKGTRVRVFLKDLEPRTFFMTADAFGLLMEPPVAAAPVKMNAAAGGYDPAGADYLDKWPTRIPFPVPSADYLVLTTTIDESPACGLSGELAAHVTRLVREEVQGSGGQPFPWANIQKKLQSEGYGPGHFGILHKTIAAWARGEKR